MWDKRAEYLSNTGDTVKMILDQGFGDTKMVNVQLMGIYAPKLDEKGGPECQEFVEQWFETHAPKKGRWGFVVTTVQIDFNRFVAVVTTLDNETNLNAALADFIYDLKV